MGNKESKKIQSGSPVIQIFPFAGSKVLETDADKFKAQSFFVKRMRSMQTKLLYRASQHKFLAQQFHKKCDGISNAVVVIKTEHDKVIGGYTPLAWKRKKINNQTGQQDKAKESFVFLVCYKDKLVIAQNSKEQIKHYKDWGPLFVGESIWDLIISDEANNNYESSAHIGNGYSNPKYKKNDTTIYYFSIKQWQVYELMF